MGFPGVIPDIFGFAGFCQRFGVCQAARRLNPALSLPWKA